MGKRSQGVINDQKCYNFLGALIVTIHLGSMLNEKLRWLEQKRLKKAERRKIV